VGFNTPSHHSWKLVGVVALEHGLAVIMRNTKDFADLGVGPINPWR
jgi:predicted nucleic acid-binding protein